MEHSNNTVMSYFIIKGISNLPYLQAPIFVMVLLLYLISLVGNFTIFLLVCLDTHLHSPMYFFLSNLSLMDMSSTNISLHNVLLNFITRDNRISFVGCMIQMFTFLSLTCNELFILTAMSYDRYVAICNPLHYPLVMNSRLCSLLAIVCWVLGFIESAASLWMVSNFSCYRSNEINHFFCDIVPIMKLTCSDTSRLELYILAGLIFLVGLMPSFLTFISYVFIITTIMRIKSNTGRRKAFYTCSSHLTVVALLYVALFCQYSRPGSTGNLNSKKLLSLFNTAAVPVLNPLIYSLKNKAVKSALKRCLSSCKSTV